MLRNCIEVENLQRAEFKSAQILPGDEISPFYLDITYEFENLHGIFELHLPKVRMDMFFKNDQLPDVKKMEECCYGSFSPIHFLSPISSILPSFIAPCYNSGVGLCLKPISSKGGCCTDMYLEINLVKEKEQEMTLEDIEKELGHKVKIVSGKKRRQ